MNDLVFGAFYNIINRHAFKYTAARAVNMNVDLRGLDRMKILFKLPGINAETADFFKYVNIGRGAFFIFDPIPCIRVFLGGGVAQGAPRGSGVWLCRLKKNICNLVVF